MNLHELLEQAPPSPSVRDAIEELVAEKAVTRELGSGVVEPTLVGWVETTFGAARESDTAHGVTPTARDLGRQVFRSLVERWAPA